MDLLFFIERSFRGNRGYFFYCKKEIVQNNRQIFKTVLCGKRTRKDSDRFLSSDGLLTKFSEFVCNVTSGT